MTGLIVPPLDERPWPTLGPQVCDLIEAAACFGPGDLRGEPAVVDDEKRALIYRAYEVFPQGHARAGKRRFKRVCISLRKGTAKTELAAWVAFAELHPDGPVRCDGFDAQGLPVGRPVRDPYIPMVAYTEEQTEELAYAALKVMCEEGPDADLFDPTLERITRAYGDGKAVALAAAPNARDGARTTFQHGDEPHRWVLPRAAALHPHFATFLLDLRYFGKSEGRATTLGFLERGDLGRAVDFLAERGFARVGVFGFSLGGAVAILTAAEDRRIRAVAAYAPFADLRGLGHDLYSTLWVLRYPLVELMVFWSWLFLGMEVGKLSPMVAARALSAPVLLIHSRRDDQIPFRHAALLQEALASNPHAEFYFPERGGHGELPRDFEARLTQFFLKHLKGAEGKVPEGRRG